MEIQNLTNLLDWHKTRRWSARELSKINCIIIHQELGEGSLEELNAYHISANHISPKGCPHICYHYGIRKNGQVAQLNELSNITWHTAGQNQNSIGIMLVGNFPGPGHDTGFDKPTPEQMTALEELVNYLNKVFSFSNQNLYGHYHFGKPACPGFVIQEWIEKRRNQIDLGEINMNKIVKSISEIQRRLNHCGYSVGNPDGIQGVQTLAAIRKFQQDQGLHTDGIVGPQTWKKLVSITE